MVDLTALPGTIDLFELMVNYVAGGIFISIVLWGIILLVTGIMGRMSMPSILIILGTFFAVSMVGYIGALAAVPMMMVALWYMTVGILNYVNTMR